MFLHCEADNGKVLKKLKGYLHFGGNEREVEEGRESQELQQAWRREKQRMKVILKERPS